MTKIITTLDTLKAVNRFSSTEELRHYLKGVYVEKERFTATDGHRLLTVKPKDGFYLADGEFESFIMPKETISALREKTKRLQISLVAIDTVALTISTYTDCLKLKEDGFTTIFYRIKEEGTTLHYKPIDGTFPEYQRVVLAAINYDDPAPSCFNPAYLGDFDFVHKIGIFPNNHPTAPMIIRVDHDHFDGLGVVMPMRGMIKDEGFEIVPSWFRKE